jgi:hypothetical protein
VTTPTYAGRVSRRYRSPARRQMRFLSWLCLVLAAACALSPVTHALGQPDSWPVCGPMAGLWLAMAVWTRWPSRERRP